MPTLTTGDNKFGIAKWIVDPVAGNGTHTTIAGALAVASSGDTIFVRPGTYRESLNLVAGVNISAFPCDARTPNVTIWGKCSATFAGTCSISSINFKTDADYSISVTGNSATIINISNCSFDPTDNASINYTSSSSSSYVRILNSNVSSNATYTFFVVNTSGTFQLINVQTSFGVPTATPSTFQTGNLLIQYCLLRNPIKITSPSSANINFTQINVQIATTGYCLSSFTSGVVSCQNCYFQCSDQPAIQPDAGTLINLSDCVINTSNSSGISGTGLVNMSPNALESSGASYNVSPAAAGKAYGRLGTFTPALLFGGGSTGITYSYRVGRYYVIGEMVFLNLYIVLTNKGSSTGTATINLPLAMANDGTRNAAAIVCTGITFPTSCSAFIATMNGGSSVLNFLGEPTTAFLSSTHFSNSSTLQCSIMYQTA